MDVYFLQPYLHSYDKVMTLQQKYKAGLLRLMPLHFDGYYLKQSYFIVVYGWFIAFELLHQESDRSNYHNSVIQKEPNYDWLFFYHSNNLMTKLWHCHRNIKQDF